MRVLLRLSVQPADLDDILEVQWEIDEAILEASAAPIDEDVHYEQVLEVFCEAMRILPKVHQLAILLRRVYGLSHKEIAKKKGVSISSMEKYFALPGHHAQARLRRRAQGGGVRVNRVSPELVSLSAG